MPSPTNKAQDNSIRENVYRVIRENITSLQLAPGTTVSTQELSSKLQVSSTPVREAFIRLQKEDLVEITPQKGTMVSRIDLTRAEKERFIRESLETAILPLFLQNCTEPDLKELELLIEKQKACFTGLKPLEFRRVLFRSGFKLGRGGIHKPALQPPARADGAERRHL